MIRLTRFDGADFVINASLIETIEQTPDTVIKLSTGRKYLVKDSMEEVVNKVIEYQQKTHFPLPKCITCDSEDVERV
ncbi:MAG: flagellar FlbD family protein [Firmicutes bacterium]|nr:flagellar FlbD family protein [Bacillota bacterium]